LRGRTLEQKSLKYVFDTYQFAELKAHHPPATWKKGKGKKETEKNIPFP
jgi:hypothetical protein